MTVSLAACSGDGTGVSDDPEIPAAEASLYATGWVDIASPAFLAEGDYFTGFSAAGRFWVVDRSKQTVLHGTSDGVSWNTVDLGAAGVPAGAVLHDGRCGDQLLVGERNGAVELVYATSYDGSHPRGIVNAYHAVTIEGDAVSVSPLSELGFEEMPSQQGDLSFRTSCVTGVHELNGTLVAVGSGQWWKPNHTGRFDPFSATKGADGQWVVNAINDAADHAAFPVSAVLGLDGVVVMLSASEEGVAVMHSSDGLDWTRQVLPLDDREIGLVSAIEGAVGAVVVYEVYDGVVDGVDEYSFYAWFSPDGVAWGEPVLLADRADRGLQLLTATEGGFYVAVDSLVPLENGSRPTLVLHSGDGLTWDELERGPQDTFALNGQVFSHEGGLVSFETFSKSLTVSGLDWPAG
ncbi:MAG TPA: hypothetical protein PK890_07100 [Terrimesophilobacter sp.]|nr:hypothetical protein [Terrimesophilobacter sp.]